MKRWAITIIMTDEPSTAEAEEYYNREEIKEQASPRNLDAGLSVESITVQEVPVPRGE